MKALSVKPQNRSYDADTQIGRPSKRPRSPFGDQIEKLTEILNVTVGHLFVKDVVKQHSGGPTGRARRLFQAASKLPRAQQQHVLTVVEAFVEKKAAV